jgi:putative transcriptional regulator
MKSAFGLILNKKNSQMSSKFKDFFDFKIEVYDGGSWKMTKFFYCKRKKVTEIYTEITDEFYLTKILKTSSVLS